MIAPFGRFQGVLLRGHDLLSAADTLIERRKKTMNYTKPEVNTLGKANAVIETVNPKFKLNDSDALGSNRDHTKAYDLDE